MIYERFRNEFSMLSSVQLAEVRRALDESIETKKKEEKKALFEEFSRKAQEMGFDIASIVGGAGRSGTGMKAVDKKRVVAKYRIVTPDGAIHEWSGRGIKPKAFAPYSKEDLNARFLIQK